MPRKVRIDVLVEAGDWPARTELKKLADRAVREALRLAAIELVPDSELSLVFTDDAHIRVLNQKFRGHDKATNVLSFPGRAAAGKGPFGPILGDIVFAEGTIRGESGNLRVRFDYHLIHLIVHGFLHLIGHDHETDAEATVMERLETAILERLGIADPYERD